MANKTILKTLKGAVGIKEKFTIDEETLQNFCWDAVNVKCIAFKKDKDGNILRAYPPTIPDKEVKDYTIISFR